ncbi:tetratricopeptide repeat-containing sulfotransferase family protein [Paremcibacter congregatus]|uniref:Sulfotransferase family protein n=1 Tax=Paremcibacter congregatus TaxID=2043170 RepID=A0A2G4YW53_9PROT|nr:tetratricopeptide repeat-containing sulfotransferase family protein [Paremcibacter congregatus]PHZ86555.1 sulfotransferase family protein [Paremcibacter congregatus]QDE26360.1 tetratricopeptide repeat protein [Paremcibacter congregatus]
MTTDHTSNPELTTFLGHAQKLVQSGRGREAYGRAMPWLNHHPDDFSLLLFMARTAISLRQYTTAVDHLSHLCDQEPDNVDLLIEYAMPLTYSGRYLDVEIILDRAMVIMDDDEKTLEAAGAYYSLCNFHEKARNCFEKALKLNPDSPSLNYNIGVCLRYLGDIDGAERSFQKARELNPANAEVVYLLSGLRRQTQQSNHLEDITSMLETIRGNATSEATLCYALAKEYEDLGEWEKSFEALNRGAAARRSTLKYNGQQDLDVLKRTAALQTKDYLASPARSCDAKGPIFILGMPRTGSTLVDTIISSHQDVFSAGELIDFPNQLKIQMGRVSADNPALARDKLASSLKLNFRELGQGYLESVKARIGPHNYFTDKLPLNFQYCGLIKRALPEARIIHVHRDPMDSCYSIYKALFRSPYPHSYNLKELAEYYVGYFRLMQHWRDAMPGQILDVKYEDVVADHEGQSRQMIDFCGLDWDPKCLDYRSTKAAITTLSSTQVRSKIYSSSIGKWKHFTDQMAPARKILDDAGIPYTT